MHLSKVVARAAQLAAAALSLGAFTGCPQWLDDPYVMELPEVGLDARDPALGGADAGPSMIGNTAGAGGSGGASGAGGARPVGGSGGADDDALTELGQLLAHRYEFEGTGSAVLDAVGDAHGTSVGAVLDGSGALSLSGNEEYVELPRGLISGFQSLSVECWVNWVGTGGSAGQELAPTWQNLFTFGISDQGQGRQGTGTRYIYLTPQPASYYGNTLRAGYSLTGFNTESFVMGDRLLPVSADSERGTQVVYILDAAQDRLSVFVDGELEGTAASSQRIDLSAITDVNNWLGRSQFLEAAGFQGELLDVRIYGAALSAEQVELSFDLGAEAELPVTAR